MHDREVLVGDPGKRTGCSSSTFHRGKIQQFISSILCRVLLDLAHVSASARVNTKHSVHFLCYGLQAERRIDVWSTSMSSDKIVRYRGYRLWPDLFPPHTSSISMDLEAS